MKEIKKRKVMVILLAATVIAVGGAVIYNTSADRLQKQLDLAEKYLTGQNYEQAAAEFDKAAEADPGNERAYTGKAEAYIGMGDYGQAAAVYAAAVYQVPGGGIWSAAEQFYLEYEQIYTTAGDYGKANAVLQEGYDLLGSRRLYDRLRENAEQVRQQEEEARLADSVIRFPFEARDITLQGYDLFEDRFEEIRALYPTEEGHEVSGTNDYTVQERASDGSYYINSTTYGEDSGGNEIKELWTSGDGTWCYRVNYLSDGTYASEATLELRKGYGEETNPADYAGLSVPVMPGDTYEEWCQVMQTDRIREFGRQPETDENGMIFVSNGENGSGYGTGVRDGEEYYLFTTEEYEGLYTEYKYDYGTSCSLHFVPPTGTYPGEPRTYHEIGVDFGEDGTVSTVRYVFHCLHFN